jgi:hypothetical protein
MISTDRARASVAISSAHESFLVYRRFRYLKLALALIVASVVPYLWWQPAGGHNGGTWLGYTLGTIGALLILWLMLFGVRKRRYGPGAWSLKAWLSAHATGVYGIVTYARVPRLMTQNRMSQSLQAMALEMLALDRQCVEGALPLGDEYAEEVRRSREETRLGGSLWRQLSGRDPKCGTDRALARVRELAQQAPPATAERAANLLVVLRRKQELLQRARRDIRYKTLLDLWLYTHVPLSFALLAALLAHVVSVFYYWG